jgi:hypothetical protein
MPTYATRGESATSAISATMATCALIGERAAEPTSPA